MPVSKNKIFVNILFNYLLEKYNIQFILEVDKESVILVFSKEGSTKNIFISKDIQSAIALKLNQGGTTTVVDVEAIKEPYYSLGAYLE